MLCYLGFLYKPPWVCVCVCISVCIFLYDLEINHYVHGRVFAATQDEHFPRGYVGHLT